MSGRSNLGIVGGEVHGLEVWYERYRNSMRGRSNLGKVGGEVHGLEVYRQTYSAEPPSSMPSGNVLNSASPSLSTLSKTFLA